MEEEDLNRIGGERSAKERIWGDKINTKIIF